MFGNEGTVSVSASQAVKLFQQHRPKHEAWGMIFPNAKMYLPDEWKNDYDLAFDAQPALQLDPNSAIPAMLTTMIDPEIYRVLWATNEAANIIGERRKGTWIDETAMFPVVEHTGEVSTYGDYNNNGSTGANVNFPQRQSYLFQTIEQFGEREIERQGRAKLSWVSEVDAAAALVMDKFQNLSYFFGIAGLQNYGLLNDPNLTAAITPAPKAYGGVKWVSNGVVVATPNEILADIQSLFLKVIQQTAGRVNQKTAFTLAMSPQSSLAMTAINSFNVNVEDQLKKTFPNLTVKTAVQYGALTATNPQGVAAGEMLQLIADNVGGQATGYAAFPEKMRAHTIVRDLSSWKKKVSGGTWGTILRTTYGIATMIGI